MGRPKLDKRNVSFSLDRELCEALDKTRNKSEVVNAILLENAHLIGELGMQDTKRMRIQNLENEIEDGIVDGMVKVAHKIRKKEIVLFNEEELQNDAEDTDD